MRVLKFNLSGKTAFFKMNDFNDVNNSYTYGHIHKVALLGVLGATLGLEGNVQGKMRYKNYIHPDFYTTLKDTKIAIIPNGNKGSFTRKKQHHVNSCGYTKEGDGLNRNLIYVEQWLYNVNWDIYINLDSIESNLSTKLEDYMLNNKAVYMPYLGKSNHPAIISNVKVLEGVECKENDIYIDSLVKVDEDISFSDNFDFADFFNSGENKELYDYRELLPYSYSENDCQYVKETFLLTNKMLNVGESSIKNIVSVDNKNIYMF